MKILFVGLGSIGQRHLQNIKKLYPNSFLYALRKRNKSLVIKETKILKNKNLEKTFNLKILRDYKQAKKLKPDLVLICNPTNFHYRDVNFFVQNKINVFVEKPIIANLNKIKKLNFKIKKLKVNTMVGYQLRFHPMVKFVKNLIYKQKYGSVVKASFKNLSYLPDYHPYEDYSKSYAAKKKGGGGVINTSSHEIDLITYFFGYPIKIHSTNIKSNNIKCDTEDLIFCNLIFKKEQYFLVNLELSFIHYLNQRSFSIFFRNAYLKANLLTSELEIFSNKSKKRISYKRFKVRKNDLFLEELRYMKICQKSKKENFLSIENNLATIKLIDQIKKFKIKNL
tara:strand:+ start:7800 stop:8813 length:1014 start_codon:yes stop_codon:yes gene_type:complete